jgi:superfamily I DNA/RNA helicase
MDETWWRKPEHLDPDQTKIISLPSGGSHLIVGPPGSGKTNLLLLRAAYLVRSGQPHIAVITFTRLLREFLATGSGNYPFEADRLQTFRSWGADMIRGHGDEVDTKGDFDTVRSRIVRGLMDLKGRVGDEAKFDCILIDEAQDYTVEEIELMRHFANDIFAVGDNNQRIYRNDDAISHLATFCTQAPPLRYHYRNGTAICRLADGIMNDQNGSMLATCNYDEARYPSSVRRFAGLTLEKQVEQALPELRTQLLAYPDEWIGVLAPTNDDVAAIHNLLAQTDIGERVQLQQYDSGYENLDHSRPIIVSTMHSAKGLEYRTAHLFALDTIQKKHRMNHQRLAYTAVTRAKTSLAIYHNKAIPGYMERGLVATIGAPTEKPKLSDLFGASS